MKKPIFALIDCNNFFVSCERIFRPDLEGKPVIVLSSNDGCAVARSNEAKALGIPMAAPAFKYRDIIERNNVIKFSANFELYGDVSKRILDILTTITPRIEAYSVDESFLELSNLPIEDFVAWGRTIRELIWRWVGVPVSIGIAPSKALAKLGADYAKKHLETEGVVNFVQNSKLKVQSSDKTHHFGGLNFEFWNLVLASTPVEDIWGIGWRLAPKFRAENIWTALDFAQMKPKHAGQIMGIHGRQLIAELNGVSCWGLEQIGKPQKSIMSTRTFGEDTHEFNVVEAAIASFAANAAFKLRRHHQLTTKAALFVTTDKHKPGYERFGQEVRFEVPTADTGLLASTLVHALKEVFQPQLACHRAGVLLYDFVPASYVQTDLFGNLNEQNHGGSNRRMDVLDAINQRFGKRTIKFAAEDLAAKWQPKHNQRSPRYVSKWDELPQINRANTKG